MFPLTLSRVVVVVVVWFVVGGTAAPFTMLFQVRSHMTKPVGAGGERQPPGNPAQNAEISGKKLVSRQHMTERISLFGSQDPGLSGFVAQIPPLAPPRVGAPPPPAPTPTPASGSVPGCAPRPPWLRPWFGSQFWPWFLWDIFL